MNENAAPEPARVKARLPIEPRPFGASLRGGALFLYAALAVALACVAGYMGLIAGRAWTSGYVAAPAIGALWFALRVFMIAGSRK